MYVENTIAFLSRESSISGLKGFSCVAFTVSLFCNYLLKDCVQNDGNGEIWCDNRWCDGTWFSNINFE